MKPNWLQVEYAIIFFMSFCVKATDAAKIEVKEPIKIIKLEAKIELVKKKTFYKLGKHRL